jgi:T-complex protein 1 subunit theta
VQAIFSGAAVGEMAMHFLEKYGIMAIRIPSKFDLRRVCRATGAVALVKVQPPAADEVGHAGEISLTEIGGSKCINLRQNEEISQVATVVLRGATEGLLADVERAVFPCSLFPYACFC